MPMFQNGATQYPDVAAVRLEFRCSWAQTVSGSSRTSNSWGHCASQSASAEFYRFRRQWSRNENLWSAEALVANDDSNLRPARAQLAEPPYADPHLRSCGRGGRATVPPMPILARIGCRGPIRTEFTIALDNLS